MEESSGLVFACVLDGAGGGRAVDWTGVRSWRSDTGPLWVHLDRTTAGSREWLSQESGLDPVVVDALLAEETRPRCAAMGAGMLVILRGVNLNPGADPEDMVSIRLWIDSERVLTMRNRKVMAISDLRDMIDAGRGPRGPGDFLTQLASRLVDRMAPVIQDLDEQADALEDELLTGESREIRLGLRELRRTAISLRRYLAPQREAMARVHAEDVPWLDGRQKVRLREVTDRVIRYVEDLDEVRERAAVVQDELMNRTSEQMNRNMYLLSVVAAVMLPLGLLTGLLGINVGGIPGAESNLGFVIVCTLLLGLLGLELWLIRRLHWL